jgi:hypothetical protein
VVEAIIYRSLYECAKSRLMTARQAGQKHIRSARQRGPALACGLHEPLLGQKGAAPLHARSAPDWPSLARHPKSSEKSKPY